MTHAVRCPVAIIAKIDEKLYDRVREFWLSERCSFVLSRAWDKKKILSPHGESNLRSSDKKQFWHSFDCNDEYSDNKNDNDKSKYTTNNDTDNVENNDELRFIPYLNLTLKIGQCVPNNSDKKSDKNGGTDNIW